MTRLATKDRCRAQTCGAPISFGLTAKNRRMPLDVEPVAEIDVEPDGGSTAQALRGLYVFEDRIRIRRATIEDVQEARPLYRPHFATCPEADRFRRRQ